MVCTRIPPRQDAGERTLLSRPPRLRTHCQSGSSGGKRRAHRFSGSVARATAAVLETELGAAALASAPFAALEGTLSPGIASGAHTEPPRLLALSARRALGPRAPSSKRQATPTPEGGQWARSAGSGGQGASESSDPASPPALRSFPASQSILRCGVARIGNVF